MFGLHQLKEKEKESSLSSLFHQNKEEQVTLADQVFIGISSTPPNLSKEERIELHKCRINWLETKLTQIKKRLAFEEVGDLKPLSPVKFKRNRSF
jgi:hypothetical protein